MRRTLSMACAIACLVMLACLMGCDPPVGGDEDGTNSPEPTVTPAPSGTNGPGPTNGPTGVTGTYVDDGFGADNYTQTKIGTGNSVCRDIVVQPDGKIILAGNSRATGQSDNFTLARYAADGYLDTAFGTSGIASLDFYGDSDTGMAAGLQTKGVNNGKIVIAGKIYREESGYNLDYFGLARFNADGTLDSSFGAEGKTYFAAGLPLDLDICTDMEILPDDSILVCGYSTHIEADTGYDVVLAKLAPNGVLDASFGAGGIVVVDLGNEDHELTSRMAVSGTGRIAVCGGSKVPTANSTDEFVMVFSSAGALDATFNGSGSQTINPGYEDVAFGIDFQDDGKLVMVGSTKASGTGSMSEIILHRFTEAGALDATFGSSGTVMVGINGTTNGGRAALALPGGKVLAVGDTFSAAASQWTILVARYGANGVLDSTFANGGVAKGTFYSTRVSAEAVALAADGAYIVAGYKDIGNSNNCFCMARYLP